MKNPFDCPFSDDQLIRIAQELGVDIIPPDKKRVELACKVSDEYVGKIVKYAHKVWKVKKEGDNYFLERYEDEEI